MKKTFIILTYAICTIAFGQVGINTESPHPSSDLELASTNKALYLNRVENPENNISSPQNGMILYDTTKKCVRAYQADAWSDCFGSSTQNPGTITALNCASATHTGILINNGNQYNSGIETTIPYTDGNGGFYSSTTINSTGVTGLVASLAAGNFNNGNGTLGLQITGTPSGAGNAVFNISIGGQSCSFTRIVEPDTPVVGTVAALDCNAKLSPTAIFVSQNYNGQLKILYTGGNGGTYEAETLNAKGLTFTRNAGNFAVGNGEIIYNVSGTPTSTGAIILADINIGGQTCASMNVGIVTGFTLYCGTGSYQPILNPDNLTAGQSYTGTYTIKYFTNSGGFYEGASYPAENFTVNGLTFSRTAGTFVGGMVTDVTYTVSGTPTNSGNMDITVNLADKTCTTTKTVTTGSMISTLECGSAALSNGNLIAGNSYSGTLTIPYTRGNGTNYPAQTISRNGLTFTRPAGTLVNGNGNIVYNVSGTLSNSNTMIIPISLGDKNCDVTLTPSSLRLAGMYCANGSAGNPYYFQIQSGETYTEANPKITGASYVVDNNGSYPTIEAHSYPYEGLIARIQGGDSVPVPPSGPPSGAFEIIITGKAVKEPYLGSYINFDINIGGKSCVLKGTFE